MEYIKKIFTISLTLVFIAVLVGVLFSPDIRGNFVALVSTLLDEGLVGYIVIISFGFNAQIYHAMSANLIQQVLV